MSMSRKVLVGVLLGAKLACIVPHYLMETVVKANIRDWLTPMAFRN